MKLRKRVQGVLEIICCISIMLIAITIESEWSLNYFLFLSINLIIACGSGFVLAKFGRWE